MNDPIITIVTAGWRGENMQAVCDSIDSQTYTKWEHLIVCDNSESVREWWNMIGLDDCSDERRHFIDIGIRTHWFGGISRNVGSMIAFSYLKQRIRSDNEWIVFLDDDNLIYSNHLETIVKTIKKNPDATFIGSDMELRGKINKDWKKIVKCEIQAEKCDLGSFAYKKELFEKYGYFRPRNECKIKFDWELIKKIADGEGMDKIAFTRKPTFIFYKKHK